MPVPRDACLTKAWALVESLTTVLAAEVLMVETEVLVTLRTERFLTRDVSLSSLHPTTSVMRLGMRDLEVQEEMDNVERAALAVE